MTRFPIYIYVVGVLLVAGCSKSELVPVEGQVFYKDQPLTSGVVMFQPAAGPPARGDIQPDGSGCADGGPASGRARRLPAGRHDPAGSAAGAPAPR